MKKMCVTENRDLTMKRPDVEIHTRMWSMEIIDEHADEFDVVSAHGPLEFNPNSQKVHQEYVR